jgi:hypothetical protein
MRMMMISRIWSRGRISKVKSSRWGGGEGGKWREGRGRGGEMERGEG